MVVKYVRGLPLYQTIREEMIVVPGDVDSIQLGAAKAADLDRVSSLGVVEGSFYLGFFFCGDVCKQDRVRDAEGKDAVRGEVSSDAVESLLALVRGEGAVSVAREDDEGEFFSEVKAG
jgi:hypothetical protein